ncbi:hypothetical protein AMATHDRAFT_45153 [Amanita thiersii Skay4041]|uniref:Adenylate cyclase n=1 Tax=Amanita thiersii Skay4041 TaxID=703135 RepID=A0A2A9NYT7_9AGAR|nr:hypothetical protein AMATHDRAFT_45153 [Amanita thiersii Skay4041]
MAEPIVHLSDAIDENGAAFRPDILLPPTASRFPEIAPWMDDVSPPPTKSSRFGFSPKPSLSFVSLRQGSSSSIFRHHRPSEIRSSDSKLRPPEDPDSPRAFITIDDSSDVTDMRKSKSSLSMFSRFKNRSRSRVRADSTESSHLSIPPPVPRLPDSLLIPASASVSTLTSLTTTIQSSKKEKKEKKDTKLKKFRGVTLSPRTPKDEEDLILDTNLDRMEGIIDPLYSTTSIPLTYGPSSPSSGFDSSSQNHSYSDNSSLQFQHHQAGPSSRISSAEFSNPFSSSSISDLRKGVLPQGDFRKVSPKTLLPPLHHGASSMRRSSLGAPSSPSWTPPESWAVYRDGVDREEGEYSSDYDSSGGKKCANGLKTKKKPKPKVLKPLPNPQDRPLKLRIYRATGSYHLVTIPFMVDVASLMPALKDKLLSPDERETHRLYVRERGRERILSPTERPAEIVKKRLEEAGYDIEDYNVIVGPEGLGFLLKFVYKSQILGPIKDDIKFDNPELVDLTGRGLRAIPVRLHQLAEQIVSLKLSCNPMLEIPLDFIQSCISLRDLRLSNMSIKRVPQSVRHATTLLRLDMSMNRLCDLTEAFLDNIPTLQILMIQNNRLESLPWYFPRLHTLTCLNVANNKLKEYPAVLNSMDNIEDLDFSFNQIDEIPNEISRLKRLKRLALVGNRVTRLPFGFAELRNLKELDCRRNRFTDITIACMLPNITTIKACYNSISSLELSVGPCVVVLDVSHNDITQLSLTPGARLPHSLSMLKLSYAKLSSIDDNTLGSLISLRELWLDHNSFTSLPESLGKLRLLRFFSVSDNKLTTLPESIGLLGALELFDAHNNNLTELPISLWNCGKLKNLNLTSNLLGNWHDPPVIRRDSEVDMDAVGRKASTVSLSSGPILPPLVFSLEKLYLGENRLADEVVHLLMLFKELKVLNLSFNDIQDMPSNFFTNLVHLEELYLSGNKLASLPTEDLPRMKRLKTLFLNGNRLQTLPQELGQVQRLTVLDVGSNQLKYNINNWEFDWNWNFNKKLKYLNLSGNKRLQIKSDTDRNPLHHRHHSGHGAHNLAGFTQLMQLRVLGLMDVTMTMAGNAWIDIPDENDERRVRTSSSVVNGMAYGIADALGNNEQLNMVDLVHEFRGQVGEAIFAMFGHAQQPKGSTNRLAKFVRDRFVAMFIFQLNLVDKGQQGVPDALRRTFLRLNSDLHDSLYSSMNHRKASQVSSSTSSVVATVDPATLKSGAAGIVLYFVGKTLYVANAGDALAVMSRQGAAILASRCHEPFDPHEMERVRNAEGWVSPDGLVNDEVAVSRSFGFFHLMPVVNARPDITVFELSPVDEFVIVADRSLWDYLSYQTAVDIARTEPDPMIAAQKLRDFAISYGAEGSPMIMVIGVADLFSGELKRKNTGDPTDSTFNIPRKIKGGILDRDIARLDGEVPAPTGHLALVFTDIRNSTHLWEVNPGMPTAMRLHNSLLRRQLRLCGGYEVKTEGDAFMCSFPTALAAVWWCLTVQAQLLHEPWPLEILECEDGKPLWDTQGRLIARGLSVRMGIHCGTPVCERDPITHRMDYFGPMVNRSARISGNAQGGHIMCSADVMREINASVFGTDDETEYSRMQPQPAIDAIKQIGIFVKAVGEVRLKGLELPEILTLIYPRHLAGRTEETPAPQTVSGSRVQLSWEQIRALGLICLRLEALSTGRVFMLMPKQEKGKEKTKEKRREKGERNKEEGEGDERLSAVTEEEGDGEEKEEELKYLYADPDLLLPVANPKSTDLELMMSLDVLSIRICNAIFMLSAKMSKQEEESTASVEDGKLIAAMTTTKVQDATLPMFQELQNALSSRGGLNEETLALLLTALETLEPVGPR